VPAVPSGTLRSDLYARVQPLTWELPSGLSAESGGAALERRGVKVDYFHPNAADVAIETLGKMTPQVTDVVSEIDFWVPPGKSRDGFALRFTGAIQIPRSGRYTFFTSSDDGSRLYIGDRLVVDNDGLHGMSEKAGRIELPAGSHPIAVTYFDGGGGDGLIVSWRGPGFRKQRIPAEALTLAGGDTLHDVAIRALQSIPGHGTRKFTDLAALVKAGRNRAAAISVLRTTPPEEWPQKEIHALADNLVAYLTEIPASYRTGGPAMDAMALARSLAERLPEDQAEALRDRLENLDVRVIAIGTVPHRMIFDKERIAIEAARPVEFRFSNTDEMPHNFAITEPGALEEVGLLAEATATDADAMARHYVPKSGRILLASRLLQPGENQALSFEAPAEPGIYPYVCTYPGHWRRMYGALYVVANLKEYEADPAAYMAANPLPLRDELLQYNTRGREWKLGELISEVSPLPPGRSFDVGRQLFKVASCVSCHRLSDEGQVFGPDLAKLDEKKRTTEHILQAILEPSKDIEEQYRSNTFVLASGTIITGMIVEETPDEVRVVVDPLAKAAPTAVRKSEIALRTRLESSIMPEGLLSKLSREEILDLIAYVYAGGDREHELFGEHHH
jgi:putative heme-binding domain-containing protein